MADTLSERGSFRSVAARTPESGPRLPWAGLVGLALVFSLTPAFGCATSGLETPSVVGDPTSAADTPEPDRTDVPVDAPTSPRAQAIDADVRGVLVEIYGSASLVGEERIEGAHETIEELRYRLGRAHRPDDGAALVQALGDLGYAIERALVDDVAAAIFAFGQESSLIMKADVGSTSLVISIATHDRVEG